MRALFPALLIVVSGCTCVTDASTITCCERDSGPPAPDSGTDAGSTFDAGTAKVTGLVIEPATAQLTSSNGSKPTQVFVAKVTLDDGTSRAVDAVFTSEPQVIGAIDPLGGTFTVTGETGGDATVKAAFAWGGMTYEASALAKVKLDWVSYGPEFEAQNVGRFGNNAFLDPNKEPGVVYPPDNVVFPQNVAPPDVQWLDGENADLFRLTFKKSDITFTAYVVDRGDHHYVPEVAPWRALAQTNPLETATLQVDRYDNNNGNVYPALDPVHLKFARAALTGSVYYWDIGNGRIVRIDDGTTSRTNFMPNPPESLGGARCVGCHVVSASGRYMAGRLGGGENIGAVFDLTLDLTPDPAPTMWPTSISPPSTQWWFASFNPDESRLVVSLDEQGTGAMGFIDPRTGSVVPVANIPPGKVTHVAWSPDGQSIAYVDNTVTWGGDFTQGDISVVRVTGTDTLGAATKVHAGASLAGSAPSGNADSYPTWSADSRKIVFAHGDGCRSELHQAALYMMGADGSQVTRLTKASGGASGASSFQPRFSPFQADGYYWLTFLSRRDYGNARVGTRGANRQQIWVAAIKVNPQPGEDPSEVAYWLPGQLPASRNIAAYWAPRACRTQSQQCSVASECCSGVCAGGVCSPPPPERCRLPGESCGGSGECCPNRGLVCKLNACVIDIQ